MLFKRRNKNSIEIDTNNIPSHIAIIMDGNGRWATKKGMPRFVGHREGAVTLKRIAGYCDDLGIKNLTVYAFSTENWKRPKEEVDYLMSLLLDYFKNAENHLEGRKIRIRVIGNTEVFSDEVKREIDRVDKKTGDYEGLSLNLAINYGSRDEMIFAFKNLHQDIMDGKIDIDKITDDEISKRLYTYDMPDPDLLIRPGGEKRLSNYLLWQSAYTEFYFSDVLWPDFDKENLYKAIKEYQTRNRRFGGI